MGRRRRLCAGPLSAHRNRIWGDPYSFLCGWLAAHARYDISQKLDTSAQLRQFPFFHAADGCRELLDAASASGSQNLLALRSRLDMGQPLVVRITFPFYETLPLEARDDSRHRRRLHLLRASELAQSERSAENDDGERGESGSGQAAGIILLAQLAQEMDRRRMQVVREGFGVLTLRHASGTSLISPTTFPCPSESSPIQISCPFMRVMMCGSERLFAPEDLMRAWVSLMSLTS